MNKYIIDIETDELNAKKIHCLCYFNLETEESGSFSSYVDMRKFMSQRAIYIGHNIIRFDIPVIERILNLNVKGTLIDTLAVSWYVSSERIGHGLEGYGIDFNVIKPKISDWKNLTTEQYVHRCSEDVRINTILWKRQYGYLKELYDRDEDKIRQLLAYLSFKMSCIAEQEQIGLKLDVEHCQRMATELEILKENKIAELTDAMPKVPVIALKTAPKVIVRKDGTLSSHGEAWMALLREKNLPDNYSDEIEVIKGYSAPNPNSHDQIKKWLFGLGWMPEHYKHVRDKKKNTVKKIPQIASREGGGEICDSIKKLYEKEPKLEILNGLSVISHRISIFQGFLRDQVNGTLYPTISGLTNTLRMQHSVIVNLPGVDKKYGEEVRSCLIAREGNTLIGSDLANIEDRTKRHFIYKYDPQYVEDMNIPGFDAHLDIAVLANMLTEQQAEAHKKGEEDHHATRQKAKIVNFSATYKIGAEALARNSNMPLKEAKRVLEVYWRRNKAILDVERDCYVKEIGAKKWLLNPINGFYYQLRAEKDRFSTLNQSSSTYVFDLWLSYIKKLGMSINFQYHDELVAEITGNSREWATDVINEATNLVNNNLKLNIQIGCSIKFGKNYATIH